MSLDRACENYRNRLVLVKPIYGWGWASLGTPALAVPAEINGVPRPFLCQIRDFYLFEGELRGMVGVVAEAGHVYDGLWADLFLRSSGEHNFTDELGLYDLEIGPLEPVRAAKDWPEFPSGSPMVDGYAIVAESLRHLAAYDRRKDEEWEIIRDATSGDA